MEHDNGASWPGQADDADQGAQLPADPQPVQLSVSLPRPLIVPAPETGEPRVDAALRLLDDLTEQPVTEHPAVFERVHRELTEVLDELGARVLAGQSARDND